MEKNSHETAEHISMGSFALSLAITMIIPIVIFGIIGYAMDIIFAHIFESEFLFVVAGVLVGTVVATIQAVKKVKKILQIIAPEDSEEDAEKR